MRGFRIVAALLLMTAPLYAQVRNRPRAEVTPLVLSDTRFALHVTLPEGVHTQSNKPYDPSYIPTEVTIDAPSGITVTEIVWPAAHDFKVEGLDQPLAVFEREFDIGVQLSSRPASGVKIPAHVRYQACDDKLCYAPLTADVEWTIGPPSADAAQ
ncbi:MAG TPA: protein-disulfide reductase DsbD N-terminal domain-containing protein, partial [Vicinamibacterales bacterium]|nr:protein-disulfide reductase DsbD N-terminal domain-containing protein [Vicinamibacterales bacterium]